MRKFKRPLAILIGFILILVSFISPFAIMVKAGYSKQLAVLSLNDGTPFEGYTLFSPQNSYTTYLIDLTGDVVHNWESDYRPGRASYLLENGNLLRATLLGAHPIFVAGGIGGGVQEIAWNSTIVWNFQYRGDTYLSHHDIEPLPNGNVLMIAWEYKIRSEVIAAGRKPDLLPLLGGLWPDHIIEVEQTGAASGNIVWEWHVWDHLIQDFDASKENYGIVTEHPELININWVENPDQADADWNHINSIDYNEEFDQIILSVNEFSEIWVIDHSTTTEVAAGHTGGNSGKGGDILYRWGNSQAYCRGDINDQKFFHQHDAQWIESGCPGEGNILVFNNGQGRPGGKYSSVEEIVPPVDGNGNYYLEPGSAYGPNEQIWIYPSDFYSQTISGAQRFPNGNTLICIGVNGIFFEVTWDKEIVWEYVNPYPNGLLNHVFKIRRYAPDYPGLTNLFQRPNKPNMPDGPKIGCIGTKYTYLSSTVDPQGDQIYYWFNWGDETNSGWIGPYDSGEPVESSHIWTKRGIYEIRVKATDEHGVESEWSNPLSMIMLKNRPFNINILFLRVLENHPNLFLVLRHILGL